jgi:hypothetical protein
MKLIENYNCVKKPKNLKECGTGRKSEYGESKENNF